MAVCPFAKHLLIPPGSSDPRITPRVAILHVDAGDAESLYTYFRDRSGGIESHFHVRKDGIIEQYRDTAWQADANHMANDFAVSIETQGLGEGEWNAAQLDSIKRLLLWLNEAHGIPLVKCPTWDGAGIGYHIQFGTPGAWTPVAKSCPGPDRIRQFHDVLVPWMASNPTEGDDMPFTDWPQADQDALVSAVVSGIMRRDLTGDEATTPTIASILRRLSRWLDRQETTTGPKAPAARRK